MTLELIYRVYYKGEELWEALSPPSKLTDLHSYCLFLSIGVLRTILIELGSHFSLKLLCCLLSSSLFSSLLFLSFSFSGFHLLLLFLLLGFNFDYFKYIGIIFIKKIISKRVFALPLSFYRFLLGRHSHAEAVQLLFEAFQSEFQVFEQE